MSFDRYGRYLIVPHGGGKPQAFTRATTFASTLDDRYGLEKWSQRMVAIGLSRRPDLLAGVAAARDDDKKRIDSLVVDAIEAAEASKGRNIGQALHEFTERIDRGEVDLDQIPDPWRKDVEAYRDAMQREGFAVELIEQTVVINVLCVAGTLDRTVLRDAERYILDVKTGQHLSLPTVATQLAIYAYADTLYDTETDTHSAVPPINREIGYVAHVAAGSGVCNIIAVDLDAGWKGATLAGAVRGWRKADVRCINRTDWLIASVKRLVSEHPEAAAAMAARWPIGVPTLKEQPHPNPEQIDAIVQLLTEVEGEHRIPFGPPDPAGRFKRSKKTNETNTQEKTA